jgi:hypothetical protein
MAFTNLDEVATWMLSNIRLSRYDDQFVNNLTLYIIQYGRITSNQHALFKKVASKYVKQFNHYKINVGDIVNLPWSVSVVESAPEHTSASITIIGNDIIFKSPYNKNFISAYRKNPIHSMNWNKDKRQYDLKYSATVLRDLMYMSAEYYEVVRYCPNTTDIINKLSEYESVKYWTPTLTYVNGLYCIKAINTSLYEAIGDIPINDDLKTISMLVKYGIKIDDSVINHLNETNDPNKVKFAANFHVEFELKDVSVAIEWLKELGCDAITEPRPLLKSWTSLVDINTTPKDLHKHNNPAVIYHKGTLSVFTSPEYRNAKLLKIVKCVNSEPIDLGPK